MRAFAEVTPCDAYAILAAVLLGAPEFARMAAEAQGQEAGAEAWIAARKPTGGS